MEELKNETVEETQDLIPEVAEVSEADILAQAVMKEQNIQQVTAKQRAMKILVQVGLYAFLGIMALIVVFPFYWMIISSLKTLKEFNLKEPTFFPHVIHFQNYSNAFKKAEMGRLFMHMHGLQKNYIDKPVSRAGIEMQT